MLTIHEAAEQIRTGKLTPVDLLEKCLARVDQLEDKVRAWVFVARDEAREQAEQLTKELQRGEYRGPLHGIPIGVKDIIDVFDWPTACGSKLWANSIARQDATVVKRLRQAGAILMGKTVTTAYASFDPPVTRNPWNLERTPGGSSSGSAAAVACGMCLGALATQTGGSITRPASYCGVCGIKPTYGRVSLAGCLPLAPSMDHMGAIASCVRDLAILFGAIADPQRAFSAERAAAIPEQPLTLYALRGLFQDRVEPEMAAAMNAQCELLRKAGAAVVPVEPPTAFAEVVRHHRVIMAVEAAQYHETRFRKHPDDYPPRITSLIEEGLRTPATEYARARKMQEDLTQTLCELLNSGPAKAFLVPATADAAPSAATTGNPVFNSPWSFTGLPLISFPIGWSREGLPLSAQLVADKWCEQDLFRLAMWCEHSSGFERRRLPI